MVLLIALIAFVVLDESLMEEQRQSAHPQRIAASYGALVRDRTFLPLAFIGGLSAAAAFSYMSGSSLVLQDGFGVSSQALAVLSASTPWP